MFAQHLNILGWKFRLKMLFFWVVFANISGQNVRPTFEPFRLKVWGSNVNIVGWNVHVVSWNVRPNFEHLWVIQHSSKYIQDDICMWGLPYKDVCVMRAGKLEGKRIWTNITRWEPELDKIYIKQNFIISELLQYV